MKHFLLSILTISSLASITTQASAQTNSETMDQWYRARVMDMDAAMDLIDDTISGCISLHAVDALDGLCVAKSIIRMHDTINSASWKYAKLKGLVDSITKQIPFVYSLDGNVLYRDMSIRRYMSITKPAKKELMAIRDNMKEMVGDSRGNETLKEEIRNLRAENKALEKILTKKMGK